MGKRKSIDQLTTTNKRSKVLQEEDIQYKDLEWISASNIHNYMLKDPLLDWLKYHKSNHTDKNQKFFNFLMMKGVEFENCVMKQIETIIGCGNIVKVGCGYMDTFSYSKYIETINLMKKGMPLIYQGVVRNNKDKTFGSPDIIIRSDYVNKIVPNTLSRKECRTSSKITNGFHYVIIDIKFCTLQLKSNGQNVLNSGRSPCNKSQVIIYNSALGEMQQYTPPNCFILGRGWVYTSKNKEYSSDAFNTKLGKICPMGIDKNYCLLINNGLDWLRKMRKYGSTWTVNPPSVPELYPNMSNQYDFPFRSYKQKLSKELKDITMLWQCGPNHRLNAHSLGIFNWGDNGCNSKVLGIKSKKYANVIDCMIKLNRDGKYQQPTKDTIPLYYNWNTSKKLEFFVDFESMNNVFDDFDCLPRINNTKSIVFMIGVLSIYTRDDGTVLKTYINFNVDSLNINEEQRIFTLFYNYIIQLYHQYNNCDYTIYHWGPIERLLYNKRYLQSQHTSLVFSDFLKVVREAGVLIEGVFDFSLKSYGTQLLKQQNKTGGWSETLTDGLNVMVEANEYYTNPAKKYILNNIIKYNEIDCKMVYEVLQYFRTVVN